MILWFLALVVICLTFIAASWVSAIAHRDTVLKLLDHIALLSGKGPLPPRVEKSREELVKEAQEARDAKRGKLTA